MKLLAISLITTLALALTLVIVSESAPIPTAHCQGPPQIGKSIYNCSGAVSVGIKTAMEPPPTPTSHCPPSIVQKRVERLMNVTTSVRWESSTEKCRPARILFRQSFNKHAVCSLLNGAAQVLYSVLGLQI